MDLNQDSDAKTEYEPIEIKYRSNYVEFIATADEQRKLKSKLLATGFVLFNEDFTETVL